MKKGVLKRTGFRMLDFVGVAHKASHTQALLWDKVSKTIVCHYCTSTYAQNII